MSYVALVTGSACGIGLATSIALAKRGFDVALSDIDSDALTTAEAEVSKVASEHDPKTKVASFVLDVSDVSAHDSCLSEIEDTLGPLTTLVNNAGVSVMSRGDLLDVTEESYDRCQSVNTRGLFFLTQSFARRLISRSPLPSGEFHSIVNITSANADTVSENRAEYCVSKAGAAMASRAFGVRLARENIMVYDVRPGLIATRMTAPSIEDYERRASEGLTLIPRIGSADEVGEVVVNLATGGLPYTTGQTIYVDGGMLVSRF